MDQLGYGPLFSKTDLSASAASCDERSVSLMIAEYLVV